MSRAKFGSLFEGQGHSMTIKHKRVRPIIRYLKSYLKLFHIKYHHIETTSRAQHLGCYFES